MKGLHKVIVQNNRLHYEFEIKRNITIIQGNSATGKTTLINMLRQAEKLYNLPYSVEEIYGLYSSGKYQNTRKIYQQMYRIYSGENIMPVEPEKCKFYMTCSHANAQ